MIMKLLFILLAAQSSAVIFAEHYQGIWDLKAIFSLAGLVSASGYLVFSMINYKKQ